MNIDTKPLKTLLLNPPSFENFDGGASSRWPAVREIESYWYPVWLTYPAGMLEGSRLLDAPPHHVSPTETIEIAKSYEFLVLFTSTVGWSGDHGLAQAIKQANPTIKITFVGPPVTTDPDRALDECSAIDFVCRREFDFSVVEFANRKPLDEILGISYRLPDGTHQHNADRPQVEKLDKPDMPWATEIYARDMDVTKYNVPFLLHPYVSLYSTRGCPAQCTFCLWPQTLSGHAWRKRSTDDVAAEMANAKKLFPHVKEFFFDDDTFNIQKARTIELCEKLKPLGLTWSCTSRVTTDYDTLKAMKDAGCRLLIVGFESGDPQILKNIKKGATVAARARLLPATATSSASSSTATSSSAFPARPASRSATPSTSPSSSTARPSRSPSRTPFPAPSSTTSPRRTASSPTTRWTTTCGHQMAHIEYPGLPVEYVMEMVHKFYDEYYFRPKAAFRVVWKAIVNRDVPRLYVEAKSFMKLRSQRNKASRKMKEENALKQQESVSMNA